MKLINENIPDKLKSALYKLIEEDNYLLKCDLNERTICHKLAVYLEGQYCDLDVDVEYNRALDNVKDLDKEDFINNLVEVYKESEQHSEKDVKELLKEEIKEGSKKRVLPDIIVHQRGNEFEKNRVVIEIKKSNNLSNVAADEVKLKMYKEELHYSEAYFIVIKVDSDFSEDESKQNYCVFKV